MRINGKTLKTILCAGLLLILHTGYSQKRYNVWPFGYRAGLNFNNTPPTFFNSKSEGDKPPYYISSVCDKDGNLIFYTDGNEVWDYTHSRLPKIPNRWPWLGNVKTLICPHPADDSLYYIFGISEKMYQNQFQGLNANQFQYITIRSYLPYCQIDYPTPLTATNYFTVLQTNASVVLAGTAHCNEKDTWIVTHTTGTMNSFLLSASGVSNTPVVSPVAATLLPEEQLQVGNSNLKFSANGEKMVVPLTVENKIVVFEFNNLTGKFSNAVKLSIPPDHLLEDVELSPDGSKLYIGSYQAMDDYELHHISQMDLDAGNVAQIEQSIVSITPFPDRVACIRSCFLLKRTMQLAPDGKIYVGMREAVGINLDLTLSVITHPNNKGIDVLYKRNAQNVNKQYKFLNYNYIRSGSYSLKENGIQVQKMVCSDRPAIFSLLYNNNIDSVKWNFGDPYSGNNNYSTNLEPQHRYPGPGAYNVEAIIYRNCLTDTARKMITVQEDKAVRVPAFIKDTIVCTGGELVIDATAPFATAYTWENGLIYPQRTIDKSGHYEITIMNDCSAATKDFDVVVKDCECRVFTPTAFTPNNDGLNDIFRPVVKCLAKQYQLKIFSRYGDVIFQSSEAGKGWDGKIKNTTAPSGVYAWILQYRNPNSKELITENGVITLIR